MRNLIFLLMAFVSLFYATQYSESNGVDTKFPFDIDEAKVNSTWNVNMTKANQFWSNTNYRGEGVKVAIIDIGVNYSLPDLSDNYLGGWDFYYDDSDPMDMSPVDLSHGTRCASIIAGKGKEHYVGVAPNAGYYALKIADDTGRFDEDLVPDAIYWAIDHDVDVISISLANLYSEEIISACQLAYANDIVLVAASGNTYQGIPPQELPAYPAGLGTVISVGACDNNSVLASLSRYGVDLVAPGVNVPCLRRDGIIDDDSGTSYACPHVAGAIALYLSKYGKAGTGKFPVDEIRQVLKSSATPLAGYDHWRQGAGLLNCMAMRRLRSFTNNAGFESGFDVPWNFVVVGECIYTWNIFTNYYRPPIDYHSKLDGDCHLNTTLRITESCNLIYIFTFYDCEDFIVAEKGSSNCIETLDVVFNITGLLATSSSIAYVQVAVDITPNKCLLYYWSAKSYNPSNSTEACYFNIGTAAPSSEPYRLHRDIKADYYAGFGTGMGNVVFISFEIAFEEAEPDDYAKLLWGEVKLWGNYTNCNKQDVNFDHLVDISDVYCVIAAFYSRPGDSTWNPLYDMDSDLLIDITDVSAVIAKMGSVC